MLDRAGQAVFPPRRGGELLECVKVELDLGDAPVGQRNPAIDRPPLDADLADPHQFHSTLAKGFQISLHEDVEL
ncbi:MAG: hypothetical protein NTW71_01390, partial [Deltaproteobacteria bacterium]|nr:hypothetical protein [Deltaproteobacteria bacterium]